MPATATAANRPRDLIQLFSPDSSVMSSRYQDKVALITGASDRGIGGAVAERLAEEGAAVSMLGRNEPTRLQKRMQRAKRAHLFRCCDVRSDEDVAAAVETTVQRWGAVDVLINNAGIDAIARLDDGSPQQWQELIDINLTGTLRVTRAVLPHLRAPGSAIVNVASVLGLAGCAGFAAYSASKSGLIGLTQSLACELAPRGIRALCVAPGLVHTPMTHKYLKHLPPQTQRQWEASHPLGLGLPHDVAMAIAFLASEEARWITGVTLPLGWSPSLPLPIEHLLEAGASEPPQPDSPPLRTFRPAA